MPDIDPAIKAEIAEARRILREDKLIASHKELRDRFDKQYPPDPAADPPQDPPNPDQPPAPDPKDPPADPPSEPRKSKWWGDALSGD
jgi:hypothetical protein